MRFCELPAPLNFAAKPGGWLAHIYYLLGDQTAAGEIYLDELNRNGSNLSRETLLNSLRMTYDYDGQNLLDHLDEYFDCGVYSKTGNRVEQIHFARWLYRAFHDNRNFVSGLSDIRDQSIYWAVSGWDLNMLLESEAPDDALVLFLQRYPDVPDVRLVRYSLAVRFARENRYDEARKSMSRFMPPGACRECGD